MSNKFDPRCHVGETHGVYTLVDVSNEKDKYGHYIYKGVCNVCGHEKFAHYGSFSGEKSKTTVCKHLKSDGTQALAGHIWSSQRLKTIFYGMISRCYNINDKNYYWYGKKGIEVCNEWKNNPIEFENWALNSGYAADLTIDRIDSTKNYCPENCQWIPLEENSRKAGKVNWITVNGITLTGKQWTIKFNISINIINTYIRKYGIEKTKEIIAAMLQDLPSSKHIKHGQTWFSVYGIQI